MEKPTESNLSVRPGSDAGAGLFRYRVSVKFVDKSDITTLLNTFDAIKKLGIFSIQDQNDRVYVLDFRSEFTKDEMEERLKEIAGPATLFDYTVEEAPRA